MHQAQGPDRELFVNFAYQPKRDARGRIDGILVVVYEVTDQVNEQREIEVLAENLRAAVLSRDAFLGIASHELNTPLTSLRLQVQLMQRQLEPGAASERTLKGLERILAQSRRLARLVDDMLDVSRIRTGRLAWSARRRI